MGQWHLLSRSTNSSAIKASIILGANANPTILATHAGAGNAIEATSQTGNGVRANTSNAFSVGAAVYGANNGTQGCGVFVVANFASGFGVKVLQ